MDKLKNVNKVQTTEYSGYLVEVELETRGKHGVHSVASVLPKVEIENRAIISTNNLLEKILSRDNMYKAMQRVIRNNGSHGVDGIKTDELHDYCKNHWATIKSKLLDGTYKPSLVRRVEIPKPNGGTRLLGIPTVVDRMIQQAIKQSLEYINQGYKWVVDMDLEKFFDKVNHDILIDRLSRRIEDKRVLDIIIKYLKSGIMLNGVIVSNEEGLELKVNEKKSAVHLVNRRNFLRFSFYFTKGVAQIRIHENSYKKFKSKVKDITNRNKGISMEFRLLKLN